MRLSDLCGLHRRFRVPRRFQLRLRLRCWQLAQQLGKLNVAQTTLKPAGRGPCGAAWLGERHRAHQAVERWVEGLAASVNQFQQQAVVSWAPTLEPQRYVLVDQEAVTVDGHPQSPAAIAGSQVLQWCIQQDPIEQDRFPLTQLCRADRKQLHTARRWQGPGVGHQPVHPDLLDRAWAFDRFTPGAGGVGGDPVAAWAQLGTLQHHLPVTPGGVSSRETPRWLVIDLHHQMGSQAEGARIHHRPVLDPDLQLPWPCLQHGPVVRCGDRHPRLVTGQGLLQLLDCLRRGDFLQVPCWRRRHKGALWGLGGVSTVAPCRQLQGDRRCRSPAQPQQCGHHQTQQAGVPRAGPMRPGLDWAGFRGRAAAEHHAAAGVIGLGFIVRGQCAQASCCR